MGRKKGVLKSAQDAVKDNARKVGKAREAYSTLIHKLAFLVGSAGFFVLILLGIHWVTGQVAPGVNPITISEGDFARYLIIAVFCASFTGWLIVDDGQSRLQDRSGRIPGLLAFGLLPIVCLVASVWPVSAAEWTGLPHQDGNSNHPFWLFVRYYPIVLIGICLAFAFRREAVPRKYFKMKRAAKFVLLTAPYVVLLIFQELSLRDRLLNDALGNTLGAVGLNAQLVLAVMTSSSVE